MTPLAKPKPTIDVKTIAQQPPAIPNGFILAQDPREQLPLFSDKRLIRDESYAWRDFLTVRGQTLHDGDYSIVGFEKLITIELKRMSDFLSYVGSERKKTEEKLQRMSRMTFAGLVVLEDEYKILHPGANSYDQKSRLTNMQIRGFLKSVNVQYGIHTYINKDEEMCRTWMLDRLTYFYNKRLRGEI